MSISYKKRQLIQEAKHSANCLGHRLSRWQHSIEYWGDKYSVAHCLDCGADVAVNQRPAPNEIDVGGAAVSLNCEGTKKPSLMTLSVQRKYGFVNEHGYALKSRREWEAEGR